MHALVTRVTIHNADAAPMQTGSSRMATIILAHFGMRRLLGKVRQVASDFRRNTAATFALILFALHDELVTGTGRP